MSHIKKEKRHDYDIYKNSHPVTPKEVVVNIVDLGYRRRKGFPEATICLAMQKEEKSGIVTRRKRLQHGSFKKEDNSENTICRLKKYRIMSDIFRNKEKT
jgi:hypothetical protein